MALGSGFSNVTWVLEQDLNPRGQLFSVQQQGCWNTKMDDEQMAVSQPSTLNAKYQSFPSEMWQIIKSQQFICYLCLGGNPQKIARTGQRGLVKSRERGVWRNQVTRVDSVSRGFQTQSGKEANAPQDRDLDKYTRSPEVLRPNEPWSLCSE